MHVCADVPVMHLCLYVCGNFGYVYCCAKCERGECSVRLCLQDMYAHVGCVCIFICLHVLVSGVHGNHESARLEPFLLRRMDSFTIH